MKQLKITKFPELDYAGSEAFNTLSTNLSFAGETVKKIMITSCHASEGKSYLSMNLMRTLAQRGMKVALVDADLRRSVVNAQYGLQFEDGRNDDKGLPLFGRHGGHGGGHLPDRHPRCPDGSGGPGCAQPPGSAEQPSL